MLHMSKREKCAEVRMRCVVSVLKLHNWKLLECIMLYHINECRHLLLLYTTFLAFLIHTQQHADSANAVIGVS